jgi:hypothetical protein
VFVEYCCFGWVPPDLNSVIIQVCYVPLFWLGIGNLFLTVYYLNLLCSVFLAENHLLLTVLLFKFVVYCCFGWVPPALITILTVVLDNLMTDPFLK